MKIKKNQKHKNTTNNSVSRNINIYHHWYINTNILYNNNINFFNLKI